MRKTLLILPLIALVSFAKENSYILPSELSDMLAQKFPFLRISIKNSPVVVKSSYTQTTLYRFTYGKKVAYFEKKNPQKLYDASTNLEKSYSRLYDDYEKNPSISNYSVRMSESGFYLVPLEEGEYVNFYEIQNLERVGTYDLKETHISFELEKSALLGITPKSMRDPFGFRNRYRVPTDITNYATPIVSTLEKGQQFLFIDEIHLRPTLETYSEVNPYASDSNFNRNGYLDSRSAKCIIQAVDSLARDYKERKISIKTTLLVNLQDMQNVSTEFFKIIDWNSDEGEKIVRDSGLKTAIEVQKELSLEVTKGHFFENEANHDIVMTARSLSNGECMTSYIPVALLKLDLAKTALEQERQERAATFLSNFLK